MSAFHLRLVAIDGVRFAPAPRRRVRDAARREGREIMLLIINGHLGYLTHSVRRIQALAKELEASLCIFLPVGYMLLGLGYAAGTALSLEFS